jgi:hypothetical protein
MSTEAASTSLPPTPAAPTSTTAFVGALRGGPANIAVQVEDYGAFEAVFGPGSGDLPLALALRQFFDNGGSLACVVRSADALAGAQDARELHHGIYALEEVELFNLLCLPGIAEGAALCAAEAYCRDRGALLLADSPQRVETTTQLLAALVGGGWPRSSHAAVFHPWTFVEGEDGKRHLAPPCGAVAGLLARTDAERGVWKAPAGQDAAIRGIDGLEIEVIDKAGEVLNSLGINSLRNLPGKRAVVWGARTLRGADSLNDEYKYVPVRRLALYLEESLYRGTQWAVFEPNAEPLWSALRLQVGTFLRRLWVQGAIYDKFVKCDATTMTQADIDAGRVNIVVGFAPLKPAEFVVVVIQQLAEPRAA